MDTAVRMTDSPKQFHPRSGTSSRRSPTVEGCIRPGTTARRPTVGNTVYSELPKLMLTIVVEEIKLEPAIAAIQAGARTGQHGDGKIFVNSVDAVYTVRKRIIFSGNALSRNGNALFFQETHCPETEMPYFFRKRIVLKRKRLIFSGNALS
jgi:Nitrogen regulatory protein P-II